MLSVMSMVLLKSKPSRPYSSGTELPSSPSSPDFFDQFRNEAFFLRFDAFEVGDDALGHKVEAGLEHHAVFFGPFFRREDVIGAHVTDEEFTAS